nr:OB-fold nucleic acid binding domain-containing protein [Clostridia bacterium]
NSAGGNTAKIAGFIQYCRKHKIPVLPPHVNHSQARFSVDRDAESRVGIRFSLGAIKNAGQSAVQSIVDVRRRSGPFRDIFDFARRADADQINKRMVESLIRAGAFDGLGANRAQLLSVYETAIDGASQERKRNIAGQVSLFGEILEDTPPPVPDLEEHAPLSLLAMEKEVTGIYITGHPLDGYRELLEGFDCSTRLIQELNENPEQSLAMDGLNVTIGGILTGLRTKATKAGQLMAFLTLEDLTGEVECLVFPKTYERLQHRLALDEALAVSGRLSVREEEETKLLVSDVAPLERLKNRPREAEPARMEPARTESESESSERLHLRVENARQMQDLLPLLSQYPGNMPVCFHLMQERKTVLPAQPLCDGNGGLMDRLCQCIGKENIKKKPLIQPNQLA